MKFAVIGIMAIGIAAFSGLGIFAQEETKSGEAGSAESEVASESDFEFDLDESDRESIRIVVRDSLKGIEGINEHIEEVLDTAMDEMERALAGVESAINDIDFDEIEVKIEEAIESISDGGLRVHVNGFEDIAEMIEEIFEFLGDWFEENLDDFFEDWGENIGGLFDDLGEAFEDIEEKLDDAGGHEESGDAESVSAETGE